MELAICFLNDVHGYLEPHTELFYEGGKEITAQAGGYAGIAGKIKDLRKQHQHLMLFDGGDTFHGTFPLVHSKGEAIVPILNEIGFDAMVGHWDFAYGPNQLKKLASMLTYPVLAINVYNEYGSLFLRPYIIRETGGIKVAVIGICSNIIDKTMPSRFSKGLNITDGLGELPFVINTVKDEGAELIILLSHNGFAQDYEMISKIPGIDICLSAHTHNRLYKAIQVKDTLLIQCGCHGAFLGHLLLDIQQHKIAGYTYELIKIDKSIPQDPHIHNTVQTIMQPYNHLKKEVVATTHSILHRYDTLNSRMDDLLLAAIGFVANVQIAFSNGWRYGAPVAVGPITKWDLYNIIPSNPPVSIIDLTGEEITTMLEQNLEKTFSANPMEQMGGYVKRCFGISVKMRIENPPGHRIQQIFVGNLPLQKSNIYKAAFVTTQGVPEKFGKHRSNLSINAVEAMEKFLRVNQQYNSSPHPVFSLV